MPEERRANKGELRRNSVCIDVRTGGACCAHLSWEGLRRYGPVEYGDGEWADWLGLLQAVPGLLR